MEKLNEHIEFLEMAETDPQLLVWLLELRRHRENNWQQRAETAEAKLAELEKQPPVGEAVNIGGAIMVEWERCISDGSQLFTRPAPAINLAELVPPETSCIGWVRDEIKEHDKKWLEMLRNIEEAK